MENYFSWYVQIIHVPGTKAQNLTTTMEGLCDIALT